MFVVMAKLAFAPEDKAEVDAYVAHADAIMKRQPGLVSMTRHAASDGSHYLTRLVWKDEASHLACMTSPDFAPVGEAWTRMVETGVVTFDFDTYELVSEYTTDLT